MVINIVVSMIPVFLFLVMLLYLDSLKLVRKMLLWSSLIWGMMSAAAGFFVNTLLINGLNISFSAYSGWIAPLVEETLKCGFIWWILKRNKIGFMIDGAIYGFAVGAAFALAENLYYLTQFAGAAASLSTWATRGFGTAVMHGGTVAIFAMTGAGALNRGAKTALIIPLSLLFAIMLHSLFNHLLGTPVLATAMILILITVSVIFVFTVNERSIRRGFDLEFEAETAILRMIRRGQFSSTKTGSFLIAIKTHFPAEVVVDIYCFISVYLELSIKAKTRMMLREQDFDVRPDPEIAGKLAELKALKKNIGRGGLLAISPVLRMRRQDLWKIGMLSGV